MARPPALTLVLAISIVTASIVGLALLNRVPSPDTEAAARAVGAKAFSRVHSDGQFDAKRSRNVRGVTRQSRACTAST